MHHRALFDLGHPVTGRTVHDIGSLFDHQRDVGPPAFITKDAYVL